MFRSFMRKTIIRAMVLIVAALGALVAVQSPAAAAYSNCPAGVGCIWMNTLGNGNMIAFPVGAYGIGGCANLHTGGYPAWAPDNTESWKAGYGDWNGEGRLRLQVWEHSNCTGLSRTMASVNDESWGFHILIQNRVSSVKILYPA